MPRSSAGLLLIVAGGAIVLIGLLVWSGAVSWFGRLPGDIRVERPNVRVYVPITSTLLLSAVFWIAFWLIRRMR